LIFPKTATKAGATLLAFLFVVYELFIEYSGSVCDYLATFKHRDCLHIQGSSETYGSCIISTGERRWRGKALTVLLSGSNSAFISESKTYDVMKMRTKWLIGNAHNE